MTAYVDWYKGDRNQETTTPRSLFDRLDAEFRFTLDGAADGSNGLISPSATKMNPATSWKGMRVFCNPVFCNPPWSDIPPFIELATTAELAVLLVPARCNARWFHRALTLGAEVRFFLGKPRFGQHKHTSPVDCVLLIFSDPAIAG